MGTLAFSSCCHGANPHQSRKKCSPLCFHSVCSLVLSYLVFFSTPLVIQRYNTSPSSLLLARTPDTSVKRQNQSRQANNDRGNRINRCSPGPTHAAERPPGPQSRSNQLQATTHRQRKTASTGPILLRILYDGLLDSGSSYGNQRRLFPKNHSVPAINNAPQRQHNPDDHHPRQTLQTIRHRHLQSRLLALYNRQQRRWRCSVDQDADRR